MSPVSTIGVASISNNLWGFSVSLERQRHPPHLLSQTVAWCPGTTALLFSWSRELHAFPFFMSGVYVFLLLRGAVGEGRRTWSPESL
jgi:hypothetical protein